jgi:hypothetical protein
MSNENATENYPLDEAAISVFADIRKQMYPLELQWQGALVLFLRQHKLSGNWRVHDNGREIIQVRSAELLPVEHQP